MPVAVAGAIPPSQIDIVNGRRVFRSTHIVSVNNDTDQEISCNVSFSLSDSSRVLSGRDIFTVVAQSSFSWGPNNLQFEADNFAAGSEITFTATTEVSGGASERASQSNTVTA
jgi:hypothetical protein